MDTRKMIFGLTALGSLALAGPVVIKQQGYIPFGDTPINYRSAEVHDPIAELQKRMDRGEVQLQYEPGQTYLRSVLAALKIPANSQTLVYSKTSFQYPKISPEKPRALYFNDDVYAGRVHDGMALEFVSFDPMQGAMFYILDEHNVEKPRFERANLDCIQCHVSNLQTKGVPGVMVRSVFTSPSGTQAGGTAAYVSGHESPFEQRWGGWYVTGTANQAHMGRSTLPDTSFYLAPTSDIVAHLVLDHQTQMHNIITQTNYQTRLALHSGSPAAKQLYERSAEQLVRYLLFAKEAKLAGPVHGDSGYAEEFAARGPRDARGRSLRDFDLRTRIFRYPCSYLIYSEAFDTLPEPAKEFIWRRLFEVLSGRDQTPEYAELSAEDRRAILEILVATKPGIPAEWQQYISSNQPKQRNTEQ
ncbi:MAG: hypothetical protein JWN34_2128 [Bryobacterales bacterium]|nr:hypothetical protein [Bryobacterales bacterium]